MRRLVLLLLGVASAVHSASLSTRTIYLHPAPLLPATAAAQLREARSRLLDAGVERLAVLNAEQDTHPAISALIDAGVVDGEVSNVELDSQRKYPIAIACGTIKELAAARKICDTTIWINQKAAEDKLQPGGRGFLSEAIIGDFADSLCYDVSGLAEALAEAEAEALRKQEEEGEGDRRVAEGAVDATDVIIDAVASESNVTASESSAVASGGGSPANSAAPAQGANAHKFCMECGTRLPRTAKFCFECGANQPTLPVKG